MPGPGPGPSSTPYGFVSCCGETVSSGAMNVPEELRYSNDHEWARRDGTAVRVGITDYAQDALGDVVFVDLPEVGEEVTVGGALGEVESTKSVSEVYAPVSGRVTAVNAVLADTPEKLNQDPYGDGWICEIELADARQLEALMDADSYRSLTEA